MIYIMVLSNIFPLNTNIYTKSYQGRTGGRIKKREPVKDDEMS